MDRFERRRRYHWLLLPHLTQHSYQTMHIKWALLWCASAELARHETRLSVYSSPSRASRSAHYKSARYEG